MKFPVVLTSIGRAISRGLTTKAAVAPLGSTQQVRQSLMGWVRESFAGAWQRGITIDSMGDVIAYSAVYACISRIVNDIAKLPINLTELQAYGTWQLAVSTSPYWQVLRSPNGYQNRIQFILMWLSMKLMFGNVYVVKQRDQRGIVTSLFIIDSRRVTPLVTPTGEVYYSISKDDLAQIMSGITLPASEVIHDRMPTLWHPLVGISPIYACGISASMGRRIQGNSGLFFENMSRPSGHLTSTGEIDDETAARLKREFEANFQGQNLGRLLVTGSGLKYEPMTIPAEQAQLIDQLKWTVEDVARAFGVPLYKINSGPMPTNNNVAALEQQYYNDCLQILIESLEMCLSEGLALPSGYRMEVDLESLMRMDASARYEAKSKAVTAGWMSPNEVRLGENMRPVAGGDTPYLQQQNFSLAALDKRDQLPNPFVANPPAASPAPAPAAPPADPAVKQLIEMVSRIVPEPAKSADDKAADDFVEQLQFVAERMKSLCETEPV
jgi:HK97 family phage portal protein